MMAFPSVDQATQLWIKGRQFTVARLLGEGNADLAKKLEGGPLCIFRLAPQDYHRFHSPVAGVIGKIRPIQGALFTVNRARASVRPSDSVAMAIRSAIDVYGENSRVIVPIETPEFGPSASRFALIALTAQSPSLASAR